MLHYMRRVKWSSGCGGVCDSPSSSFVIHRDMWAGCAELKNPEQSHSHLWWGVAFDQAKLQNEYLTPCWCVFAGQAVFGKVKIFQPLPLLGLGWFLSSWIAILGFSTVFSEGLMLMGFFVCFLFLFFLESLLCSISYQQTWSIFLLIYQNLAFVLYTWLFSKAKPKSCRCNPGPWVIDRQTLELWLSGTAQYTDHGDTRTGEGPECGW